MLVYVLTLRRAFSHFYRCVCSHPKVQWLGVVALLLAVASCQPVGSPALFRELPPAVEQAECPFALPGEVEGYDYACGILRVPQMRDDPEGLQLGIFFARLNAIDSSATMPPLLFLAGGPGASGVYDAPLLAPTLAPLRADRDLLFFDIRGAGFSQPRIDCVAFAEGGAGPACMKALRQQGIKPMAFNTTQAAADAADLLTALGYEQADLLAVSYGTRLGLEMMRTQPQFVRALVLDSTVAPETLTYELQAIGDYQAKLWPYADCEADVTCRGRFGAMAGRFLALLNRLDEKRATDDSPGLPSAAELYNLTDLTMGRPDLMALMPLIVDELDRGEVATYRVLVHQEFDTQQTLRTPVYAFERFMPRFDALLQTQTAVEAQALRHDLAALANATDTGSALLEFIDARLPESVALSLRALADAMTTYERNRLFAAYGATIPLYEHRSLGDVKTIIDCQEEIPFVDPETIRKNQAVIPLPSLLPPFDFAASVHADQRACLDMGLHPAPSAFKDSVTGDQPVLLLSGTQDSTTPALWSELVAESLPNAQHILFPAYGHALIYQAGDCVAQLTRAFLAKPMQPVDAACTPTVDYVLERPLLAMLTQQVWRLQGWAGKPTDGASITAFFSSGRVTGRSSCGTYGGDFSLHDEQFHIDNLTAVNEECAEAEQALQDAFLRALSLARTLTIRDNRMMLTTAAGDLLIFTAD